MDIIEKPKILPDRHSKVSFYAKSGLFLRKMLSLQNERAGTQNVPVGTENKTKRFTQDRVRDTA